MPHYNSRRLTYASITTANGVKEMLLHTYNSKTPNNGGITAIPGAEDLYCIII
jgi:hypothetical protein